MYNITERLSISRLWSVIAINREIISHQIYLEKFSIDGCISVRFTLSAQHWSHYN
jgi:hypothetical protein